MNCNSTKGHKDVRLSEIYLADRDNTSHAFLYTADGIVQPAPALTAAQKRIASATLKLTGLDKEALDSRDENDQFVAIDRVRQRMEVWLIAADSKDDLAANATQAMRRQVVRTAVATGYFSIWMTVYSDDPEMRRMFIEGFPGTAPDCFDASTRSISPRPSNGLLSAGKV